MALQSAKHYAFVVAVLWAAAAGDYSSNHWASGASSPPDAGSAAPPGVDCSSLVLTMADCLSYVSNGSTTEKPEGTCCSGLKTVLKTDAECLCEAFRSSAQLGVVLNVTKALALPSACKVSAASASNCGLSITPASSPVMSPESSPPSDFIAPPSTTTTSPTAVASNEVSPPVPAPSTGTSGSYKITASVGLLLLLSSLALAIISF